MLHNLLPVYTMLCKQTKLIIVLSALQPVHAPILILVGLYPTHNSQWILLNPQHACRWDSV